MSELEEIKRKKIEELQRRLTGQQDQDLQERLQLLQQIEALENIAKKYLTKEAIQRYGNLKAAHPEKAVQAIVLIAQAAQTGQIKEKITDERFKEVLRQLQEPKKEFKIKRR